MVPGAGLEPARSFLRGILSPLCLPIPPPGHEKTLHCTLFSSFIKSLEAEVGIEPA